MIPADLSQLVNDRSVILVGNDPVIDSRTDGDCIEEHDVIIRFNKLPTPDLYPARGERTDAFSVGWARDLAHYYGPWAIWTKQDNVHFARLNRVDRWFAHLDSVKLYRTSPSLFREIREFAGCNPSAGLNLAYTLARKMRPSSVALTGVTCWGRLWSPDGTDESKLTSPRFHNPRREAHAFQRLGYQHVGDGNFELVRAGEDLHRIGPEDGARREGADPLAREAREPTARDPLDEGR